MEGRHGLYSQGNRGWTSWRKEEFQEEDVWGVLNESKVFYSKPPVSSESFRTITPRRLPSASKMIPRSTSSNNNNNTQEPQLVQQSAPVSIPDWPKIDGKNSKKVSWLNDDDDGSGGGGNGMMKSSWDSDEDDESDGNMIPPHEWVARKQARSDVSSFSVCEGAGRTLKGRDLSRVRNAVLRITGFLE